MQLVSLIATIAVDLFVTIMVTWQTKEACLHMHPTTTVIL